jgi:predicted O-methyltransferase YrrM
VFIDGDHSFDAAMSDFERFGMRTRVGGAVLFDDAVFDGFSEPGHTADVKRVVREVARRGDFRLVRSVRRLVHFERVSRQGPSAPEPSGSSR